MRTAYLSTILVLLVSGTGTFAQDIDLSTPGVNCGTLLGQPGTMFEQYRINADKQRDCERAGTRPSTGMPLEPEGRIYDDNSPSIDQLNEQFERERAAITEKYERQRREVEEEFSAKRRALEAERRALAERKRQLDEALRANEEEERQAARPPTIDAPDGGAAFYEVWDDECDSASSDCKPTDEAENVDRPGSLSVGDLYVPPPEIRRLNSAKPFQ